MVGQHKVVVYRFWHIHHRERQPRRIRCLPDLMPRPRRIVAPDDEPVADVVAAHQVQDNRRVFVAHLAPGGAERRARRVGDARPFGGGWRPQVNQIGLQQTLHPVRRAVQIADAVGMRQRLLRQPVQAAVQHGRAAARLHHKRVHGRRRLPRARYGHANSPSSYTACRNLSLNAAV